MLGVRAFGGRVLSPDDDKPGAPPVAVLSHRVWQASYGSDPSVVGSSFTVEGHPFTVIGVAPPGFFGETLRGDPPDMWIPVQQEPLIDGESELLHQSIPAWLRVIGRLRPGASVADMGPRLTGVLRHWLQYDSGYPANWMPDVIRTLPKQVINVIPAGIGVAEMKEDYGRSLQILFSVCGLVLLIASANVANLLLARAVTRRGQTAVRLALGATQAADHRAGSHRKRSAGDRRGSCRAACGRGGRAPAAGARISQRALPAHQPFAVAPGPGLLLSHWR